MNYNFIRNKAINPSLFVNHLLQNIFSEHELKEGTISGYSTKGSKKQKCKKLDEKRIGACKGNFIILQLILVFVKELYYNYRSFKFLCAKTCNSKNDRIKEPQILMYRAESIL